VYTVASWRMTQSRLVARILLDHSHAQPPCLPWIGSKRFMREKQREEVHEADRKISLRWKVLQVLGGILIGLGLLIDWPAPQEADLPDTSSFLVIVGAVVMAAGLLLALRRE